ncbi:MAG: serine/threonine protein kinase [Bryobacterales bacterium]|nr:serine/threonine protein kinase [Bryobacterales bacterium]
MALNHPWICQIHDVGPDYLVLEYVDGAPVKEPIAVEEAVRLALQIVVPGGLVASVAGTIYWCGSMQQALRTARLDHGVDRHQPISLGGHSKLQHFRRTR